MTVEYRLTPVDVQRFLAHAATRSPFLQQEMARGRWSTIAMLLAFSVLIASLTHRWELVALVAFSAFFVYPLYPAFYLRAYLKRATRYQALEGPPCLGQIHALEVLPSGIRTGCASCDTRFAWSVLDIQEVNEDTYIFIGPSNGLVLNRTSLVSGDYEALRGALRNKGA